MDITGTLPAIVSPRTGSMVLAAFPWYSDIIMHASNITDALKGLSALEQNLFLEVMFVVSSFMCRAHET